MGVGRVLLVCGMPGAGKSTLARRLAAERDGVLLCPDDWFVALGLDPHDARRRRAFERLQGAQGLDLAVRGLTVVFDFGLWTRPDRRRWRDRARSAGAAVELHALDVPLVERWRRVERRNAEPGAVVISRGQLESFERWWQPPDADELASYDAPPGPSRP
ncbi:AAA family ATPase [Nocardioides sp.]|uniref:AAA family ATPase n=1 Tax=Nocardioides sp. TaxID=35761 RepID=UPI00271744C4|nr:AAA family ATPase [Nocardioides sp.]MDO9454736.1 AAA family ATPase [Nocardioides sp.]